MACTEIAVIAANYETVWTAFSLCILPSFSIRSVKFLSRRHSSCVEYGLLSPCTILFHIFDSVGLGFEKHGRGIRDMLEKGARWRDEGTLLCTLFEGSLERSEHYVK